MTTLEPAGPRLSPDREMMPATVTDPGAGQPPTVSPRDYLMHFANYLLGKILSTRTLAGAGTVTWVDQMPIEPALKAKITGVIGIIVILAHAATDIIATWKGTKAKPIPH